jgi:hypothetical protein
MIEEEAPGCLLDATTEAAGRAGQAMRSSRARQVRELRLAAPVSKHQVLGVLRAGNAPSASTRRRAISRTASTGRCAPQRNHHGQRVIGSQAQDRGDQYANRRLLRAVQVVDHGLRNGGQGWVQHRACLVDWEWCWYRRCLHRW